MLLSDLHFLTLWFQEECATICITTVSQFTFYIHTYILMCIIYKFAPHNWTLYIPCLFDIPFICQSAHVIHY